MSEIDNHPTILQEQEQEQEQTPVAPVDVETTPRENRGVSRGRGRGGRGRGGLYRGRGGRGGRGGNGAFAPVRRSNGQDPEDVAADSEGHPHNDAVKGNSYKYNRNHRNGNSEGRSADVVPEGPKSTDTLYIKNISFSTTKEELLEFFECNDIDNIVMPYRKMRDFKSGKIFFTKNANRGMAFIKYPEISAEDLQEKLEKYNGCTFKGRELTVDIAVERPAYEPVSTALPAETEVEAADEETGDESAKKEEELPTTD